jgi:hypothetical protein
MLVVLINFIHDNKLSSSVRFCDYVRKRFKESAVRSLWNREKEADLNHQQPYSILHWPD